MFLSARNIQRSGGGFALFPFTPLLALLSPPLSPLSFSSFVFWTCQMTKFNYSRKGPVPKEPSCHCDVTGASVIVIISSSLPRDARNGQPLWFKREGSIDGWGSRIDPPRSVAIPVLFCVNLPTEPIHGSTLCACNTALPTAPGIETGGSATTPVNPIGRDQRTEIVSINIFQMVQHRSLCSHLFQSFVVFWHRHLVSLMGKMGPRLLGTRPHPHQSERSSMSSRQQAGKVQTCTQVEVGPA